MTVLIQEDYLKTISLSGGLLLPRFEINVGEAENIVATNKKEFSIDEFNFVKANWVDNKYSDYIKFKFNNIETICDSHRDVTLLGFYDTENTNLDIEVI